MIGISSLAKIANSEQIDFLGILTQEDKPAGRKLILKATPVAEWATKNNLPLEKLDSINNPNIISKIKNWAVDIIFLASFGQILKSDILSVPLVEALNLHASLLPKFRGASPIQAAILAGDKQSGVSFMRMEKGLDTGPVFAQFASDIAPDECADSLETKLANLAAEYSIEVILKICSGELKPVPQDNSLATYAGKIEKSDGKIEWNNDADVIERKIRAFHPWPGAFFDLDIKGGKLRTKITKAKVVPGVQITPGEIICTAEKKLLIACGKNALEVQKIHPEGRKEMDSADFLRGQRIPEKSS